MAAPEEMVTGFSVSIDVPDVPKEAAPPWQHNFCDMVSKFVGAILAILAASNPVFDTIQELDLSKHILLLAIPMAIGIFTLHKLVEAHKFLGIIEIFLPTGATLTWNGILMRRIFKRASKWLEVFGIVLILAAFFSFAAFLIPGIIIPAFCFIFCVLPFVIAFCCGRQGGPTASDGDGEHGLVMLSRPPV